MHDVDRRSFATKREARAFARQLRRAWPAGNIQAWSAAIARHLTQAPTWHEAATVLTYVGALPGELDTRPLIAGALEAGKRVLVPVTRPDGLLAWSALTDLADLAPTDLGLLEPPTSAQALAEDTGGLCIVPGMLFREDGHRIGFGGGYYDRFLSAREGPAVGLCPAACFGHKFPVVPHDVPVGWVITEAGVVFQRGTGSLA